MRIDGAPEQVFHATAPGRAPVHPAGRGDLNRHIIDDRCRTDGRTCDKPVTPIPFDRFLHRENIERPRTNLPPRPEPPRAPERLSTPSRFSAPATRPAREPSSCSPTHALTRPARIGDVPPAPRERVTTHVRTTYRLQVPIPNGMTIDVLA